MEEISSLMQGFAIALTPYNLMLMLIGILLGVIIGVLPGLGGANGVAILLPLTFTMPPTSAIIMLSCIYWGALFGGAITSILFNIPGEPWSVATTFDGHPMAQQGRADEALTAAFTSSFVGALVAVILITFLAPLVAKFALKFGPAEFFAVFFLTFASFIGMGKGSPFKVIASMCLGFALGAVGLDKCPNVEFWRDLPSLVKEGCGFTYTKLRSLCGEITAVQAMASTARRGFAVEDTAAVLMRLANGALGSFLLSDATASARNWQQTAHENPAYASVDDEDC